MKKSTITPDKVKVIESVLEERKTPTDRRRKAEDPGFKGPDRRSGQDRRNP